MYTKSGLVIKYLRYLLSSSNGRGHGIHSPFIYDLITRVLNDRKSYEAYAKVEGLRRKMLKDNRRVRVDDMGAGSALTREQQRTIASIARYAAKSKKFGQLLFRMAHHYKPGIIIEFGTSLGITAAYLALANPAATVFTLEGASAIARVAEDNFESLQLHNISLVVGNFNDTLLPVLEQIPVVDMAFIDGNHRQLPTEHYFNALLSKAGPETIMVFDDIHWSREMEMAWETVKNHPAVRCTVDLFFIGIVLFRREFHEKQHFTIRF